MRSILVPGLLMTLCASANAATLHHHRTHRHRHSSRRGLKLRRRSGLDLRTATAGGGAIMTTPLATTIRPSGASGAP
jgi:hypothetical protein